MDAVTPIHPLLKSYTLTAGLGTSTWLFLGCENVAGKMEQKWQAQCMRSWATPLRSSSKTRRAKGSGNKPPGVVPGKMVYMGRDIHRLNDFTGSKRILFVHLVTIFSGAQHAFRSVHNTFQKRLDQSNASDNSNGYDKP